MWENLKELIEAVGIVEGGEQSRDINTKNIEQAKENLKTRSFT